MFRPAMIIGSQHTPWLLEIASIPPWGRATKATPPAASGPKSRPLFLAAAPESEGRCSGELENFRLDPFHNRISDESAGREDFDPDQFSPLIQFRRDVGAQLDAARLFLVAQPERLKAAQDFMNTVIRIRAQNAR